MIADTNDSAYHCPLWPIFGQRSVLSLIPTRSSCSLLWKADVQRVGNLQPREAARSKSASLSVVRLTGVLYPVGMLPKFLIIWFKGDIGLL